MLEDREHQRNVLHDKLIVANINSIQNVKRVLNEEKDARSKDFLSRGGEHE